ncbi:DUF6489 family protein [Pukyongiella litopenaei]|uniref:Uncharacterized protein n=1 Tax=Pukyongiella litopenaei TaxID=2605946 RepID=A0A5C2H2D0_9RHOB|nr:DUF6489 family protein [Pukyongiella litopenaei]QEP30607.1 hypothetical protein C6Y53_20620 [Pukyongiella litopenaei]
MQVNISIDLTPAEAREMLGLPNVQKLQEEWLKSIEDKIMSEAAKLSPETILKSWTAGASSNVEMLTSLMSNFAGGLTKPK